MKRFRLMITAALMSVAFAGFAPLEASAQLGPGQPVVDWTAIGKLGLQLTQLETQAGYLKQQLAAIATFKPYMYKWSDVSGTINQLGEVIQQTNAIAYSASDADAKFRQQFPGYGKDSPQNFIDAYKQNVNTTMATLDGVLKSLGQSAEDFTHEPNRISFLQNLVQNAQGQTQAIQASAQISTEMISQIQMLRQTVMAQTNAQTAYYAQQVQNQATAQKKLDDVIQAGSTDTPAYGSSGQYLHVPNF